MKAIIANDIDCDLARKKDVRAYASRALWFAEAGDVIISSDRIDSVFVDYVGAWLGFDEVELGRMEAPAGRYGRAVFDPLSIEKLASDERFRAIIGGSEIENIVALWPSSSVGKMVELLHRRGLFAGARFFGQGGGALLNDKTTFRSLSAAYDFPVAPGTVVRSCAAAASATRDLLRGHRAVIAKAAHGGAGARNDIILLGEQNTRTDEAGAKRVFSVATPNADLDQYWEGAWDRLSDHDRFGVVVEAFVEDCRTAYAEFWCGEQTSELGAIGDLVFSGGHLGDEVSPSQALSEKERVDLERLAQPVAERCRLLGYRGPLSVDAIVESNGKIWFTEINCRYTGSTHLWRSLLPRITGRPPAFRSSLGERYLVQSTTSSDWQVGSLARFSQKLSAEGILAHDPSQDGVIMITPVIGGDNSGGPLIYATVSRSGLGHQEFRAELSRVFGGNREL
jgi:hypothetical protein